MITLKIKTTDLPQNQYLKDYVERKLKNLDKMLPEEFGAIVEVELAKTTNHHKTGDFFKAEMQVQVPGGKMVRSESTHDTIEKAIAEVANNLMIELEKYKDKTSLDKRKEIGRSKGMEIEE